MPGFYKVGYTTNWHRRRLAYQGPCEVGRLFFARPVSDKFYAELCMKAFLCANGFKPRKRFSDWFVRS